jgi:hypothetical protein
LSTGDPSGYPHGDAEGGIVLVRHYPGMKTTARIGNPTD